MRQRRAMMLLKLRVTWLDLNFSILQKDFTSDCLQQLQKDFFALLDRVDIASLRAVRISIRQNQSKSCTVLRWGFVQESKHIHNIFSENVNGLKVLASSQRCLRETKPCESKLQFLKIVQPN